MGLSNFTPSGPSNLSGMNLPPAITGGSSVTDMLVEYNTRFAKAAPALYRDDIITQLMSIITSSRKPNALLIGSAGVGKTAVVEEIARRIAVKDASVPPQLADMTIFELPLASLVAGAGIVGELEERITEVIKYAQEPSNKAIIFIDEIHLVVDDHNPTYSKIAQVLKPALARGNMRVIGATTTGESRRLDNDPAFKRRFSSIIIDELTSEQTRHILDIALPGMVSHYRNSVMVNSDVLDDVVTTADHLMTTGHRPDTALTLLDRALSGIIVAHHAAIQKALDEGDTIQAQVLQQVTQIPLTSKRLKDIAMRLVTGQSQNASLDIEHLTSELSRLKGQEDIMPALITALRRRDLGVFPMNRPTSWLFAGASGVGKSESARIISRVVTGQEPILLNMAEYHSSASINRIIGSPAGYVGSESAQEKPFDTLLSNPYRVIVLDEFEKADLAVQRLFLSALDTGEIQMASGSAIDVSRCIVIATTNAAREKISRTSTIGFGNASGPISRTSLVKALQSHFDAELLGRFDDLIAFAPMTREIYTEVLLEEYKRQTTRITTENPNLSFDPLDDKTIERLVDATWLPDQGARPAIRAVQTLIEDMLLN